MRSFFIRPSGRYSGWVNDETCEALIYKDSMIRVEGDGCGLEINCIEGILWITRERDIKDHFISSSEDFIIDERGLVLITAFEDAVIKAGRGVTRKKP